MFLKHCSPFRYLLLFSMIMGSVLMGCNRVVLDPNIKEQVEAVVGDTLLEGYGRCPIRYNNLLENESYVGDSVLFSTYDQAISRVFECSWSTVEDTLIVNGHFRTGNAGANGFMLEIVDDKPVLYFDLSGHLVPIAAYSPEGEMQMWVQVECAHPRVILAELPNGSEDQILFGFVEGESAPFYVDPWEDETGQLDLHKDRVEIRIKSRYFFKANHCDE